MFLPNKNVRQTLTLSIEPKSWTSLFELLEQSKEYRPRSSMMLIKMGIPGHG